MPMNEDNQRELRKVKFFPKNLILVHYYNITKIFMVCCSFLNILVDKWSPFPDTAIMDLWCNE
jgi:hypothetical protein